jgi:hypothetical protein
MIGWRFATIFVLLVVLAGVFLPVARAQDEPKPIAVGEWRREGKVGLNLLQSYYTNDWKGGDKGSVVWAANLDYRAEAQLTTRWNWRNDLNLAFGQTHQQERDATGDLTWQKPDKTTDQIKFETLFRYGLQGWDPYVSARFESQFLDETDPWARSLTLNPLTFSESIGISHMLVNQADRQLMSRFGFSLRQNSREVFAAAPPDDATERLTSNDGGLELVLDYKDKILDDRVEYTSKFTAYKAFFYSAKGDLDGVAGDDLVAAGLPEDVADYSLVTDLDWENTFVTAITRLINVQLYLRWSYDKYDNSVAPQVEDGQVTNPGYVDAAIRKAGQLKQTMSIGLAYAF